MLHSIDLFGATTEVAYYITSVRLPVTYASTRLQLDLLNFLKDDWRLSDPLSG